MFVKVLGKNENEFKNLFQKVPLRLNKLQRAWLSLLWAIVSVNVIINLDNLC
jgi:hypothetical protein